MALVTTAAAQPLNVPIPPGNEGLIQSLTAPLPSTGSLGAAYDDARLEAIQIGPWSVDFVVLSEAGEARVRWSIARETLTSEVTRSGVDSAGARAIAEAVRRNIQRIDIRRRPSKPSTEAGLAPASPHSSPDPEPTHLWVLLAGLLYAGGLATARRGLRDAVGRVGRSEGIGLLAITAACGLLIALLPETVVYHRGHGWRWVQTVAGHHPLEAHNGVLAGLASRALGVFGTPGREAHLAANMAYILSVPAAWLWARALWRKGLVAVWFAGLLASQPALIYLGSSHYSGSIGILLALLAGFHLTAAARVGTWGTVAAASGALAWLLNWRFEGVVVAPGIVLVALSVALRNPLPRRVWIGLGGGLVGAMALAAPHWYGVFEVAGVRTDIALASLSDLWNTNLMAQGHAASSELTLLALAGVGVAWWLGRRSDDGPAVGWLTLGLAVCALLPLWFGLSVSNGLLDEIRYSSWAILGCALAASTTALAFEPRDHGRTHLVALAVTSLLVMASVRPGSQLLAVEHPEQLQARLVEELGQHLPTGVTVAYPAQRGLHRIDLPILPLRHSRPDLTFVPVSKPGWEKQADFWLLPLTCHIPKLIESAPKTPAPDACELSGNLEPVYTLAVTLEQIPSLETSDAPMMFVTDGYWVSPPIVPKDDHPPFIGLYKPR